MVRNGRGQEAKVKNQIQVKSWEWTTQWRESGGHKQKVHSLTEEKWAQIVIAGMN